MGGFLTFLLSVVCGFYVLGFISKWALRYWIRKQQQQFTNRTNSNNNTWGNSSQANSADASKQRDEEGKVYVQKPAPSETKVSDKVGEYVDFEEIK